MAIMTNSPSGKVEIGSWFGTKKYCFDDKDPKITSMISKTNKIVYSGDSVTLLDKNGAKILSARKAK